MNRILSCSVGVMAFNEEANIGFLLNALLRQRVSRCSILEIIVVASGCVDETERVVRSIEKANSLVKLVVQEKREGKASAINLFLGIAKGDIAVVESGDTIPEEDTIERLVEAFQDPGVGMTGAHPIPVDSNETFMGHTVNLVWRLHHELALKHPKLGELIAFRKDIVPKIPNDTAVDEASIEAIVFNAGYRIHYAKDAIVMNKGPETVRDFLKQRRRIMTGHKHLQMTRGYTVNTMKLGNLVGLLNRVSIDMDWSFRAVFWTVGAIFIELFGRFLGVYDFYIKKKNPTVWETANSTKRLTSA